MEILKGEPLSDEEYFKAATLGWCVEMVMLYRLSCFMLECSPSRKRFASLRTI